MNNLTKIILLGCFAFGILVTGCSKQGSVTSSLEAIDMSKTLETTQEKVNYLITEANALLKSERFQDVINIAQYILTNLDSNSQPAKSLLDQAKTKLAEATQEGAAKLGNKLTNFGK